VSDNFYWLSTKLDTLDWSHKLDTVYTPQKEFADLTGLQSLPQVQLESKIVAKDGSGDQQKTAHVVITNPSKSLAFMVHLRVTDGEGGADIVPAFYDDNYFSLLPGEHRDIAVRYGGGNSSAVIAIDGFNIAPATLKP